MVSSAEDERTASRVAVERAAEALGAEVAALLRRGEVVASVGVRRDPMVEAALADIAEGRTARLMAPGLEDRPALAITVDAETPSRLVFAREGTRERRPCTSPAARSAAWFWPRTRPAAATARSSTTCCSRCAWPCATPAPA
jgi:hypothetical protein